MRFFVHTTSPPTPKNFPVRIASIALTAVFVILAVAQLYSFEDFPDVLASLWLPGGHPFATLLAALIVTGEVLAVPFLLSMRLSPAMRAMSMFAGWGVMLTWIKLTVFSLMTTDAVINSGVLGATIPVAPGWWLVGVFIVLGAATGWVSWGLWPLRMRAKNVE